MIIRPKRDRSGEKEVLCIAWGRRQASAKAQGWRAGGKKQCDHYASRSRASADVAGPALQGFARGFVVGFRSSPGFGSLLRNISGRGHSSFSPPNLHNGIAGPMSMLLRLPLDPLQTIMRVVHEADRMPGPFTQPTLLALYRTCRAVRTAMLPLIGSTRLLLAEDEGPGGRDTFAQDFLTQLSCFPSAATLRVLHLEIGPWTDELADTMLDPRIAERLATVVDLVVIQPGDAPGRPTNWRVICGMIAMAFPLLRSLALLMDVPPTLFVVQQLHRLERLTDLRLHCTVPPPKRTDPVVAHAIGHMTRLRSLSLLQASDFSLCLSGFGDLTNLERLHMFSEIPGGIRGVDLPGISGLSNHHHLTELVWCGANNNPLPGTMPSTTMAAISCITQVVHLDIRDHDVQGTNDVQLLASIPHVRKLVVHSLLPDAPIAPPCSWKDLWIVSFSGDLRRLSKLPLTGLEALRLGSDDPSLELFEWDLGCGDCTEEDGSALAALVSSTFRVLTRTRSFDPAQHQLRLSWTNIPTQPTLAIASATSELRILDLVLCHWDLGGPFLQLLAETQPRLQKLTLVSCCAHADTWAALATLPRLTHLYVLPAQPMLFFDEDLRQLALFVSGLGRELTLCVNVQEFEAVKRMMLARRQAMGKSTNITLIQSSKCSS